MANFIVGQVEALLPDLIAAMKAADDAKADVENKKAKIAEIIGTPQTVKTVWGSVTLKNGRRTVKVVDRALAAQITHLKEQGVADGRCTVSVSAQSVSVTVADR